MNQSNNDNINVLKTSELDKVELDVSAIDSNDEGLISRYYSEDRLLPIMVATLKYIDRRIENGLMLPYFTDISLETWQHKIKALDIYITDKIEGRELNLEARGKDYATNILSYPSEMPVNIIELMPTLPLGELIICHEVVAHEAIEQEKTLTQHISHLLVHGMLHLLGFDHELGQAEQEEMEGFEIEILASLNLPNPYLPNT
ncbi:rRNA maturation RNase YbeY [Psychrobacter sp. Cmf 22.2]|uniref:rRNA maturation RNase YbeY n=1 Tax=Psychrobacter sp. Cmf 22.2 TaxID=1926478 RepID=UPI000946D3BE|nr:rRNA maturation RNase YbeY [Psychrobacter sp. Cmf 22.2]OLF36393.1 rRNA maturation RNase YbeY [Psychrobacter sp. Cmf 22.2]